MGGLSWEVGGAGSVVVIDYEGDGCWVWDQGRALAAALVEDEDVGWVVDGHEGAFSGAVDCAAFD